MAQLNEIIDLTRSEGIDPETVTRAWEAIRNTVPGAESKSSQEVASKIIQKFKPNQLPQVQVEGRSMNQTASDADTGIPKPVNVPTQLASPYAGSNIEARNPQTPTAEYMNQFDPQAMRRAYDEYYGQYRKDAQARNVQNYLGAGAPNQQVNQQIWDKDQERKMADTIGRQLALQDQATKGVALGSEVQKQAKTAGEYTGTQAEKGIDIASKRANAIVGNLGAEQAQRMNQSDSPETQMAKSLILSQIASVPTASKQALARIVQNPDVTAAQLMPAMAQFVPAAHKAFLDMLSGQQTQASTALTNEQARQAALGTKIAETVTGGGTKIPSGFVPTISAGPVGLSSPEAAARSAGSGAAAVDAEGRFRSYKTSVEPQIDATLAKLDKTGAGKGTQALAAWLPGNEQQELVNMLADINNRYPAALPADMAARITAAQKQGGFTGSAVSGMTTDQLRTLLKRVKLNAYEDQKYQQNKDKAEATGTTPSSFGARQGVTVPMVGKDGSIYDVPSDKVEYYKSKGYKVQ